MSEATTARDRALAVMLRAVAVFGAVLSVVSTSLVAYRAGFDTVVTGFEFFPFLISVFFGVFVWLIAPRQPRNAVVWTMAAAALFSGLTQFGNVVSAVAYDLEPALFEGEWVPAAVPRGAAWIVFFTEWMWIPAFVPLLTFGVLLFPDGRMPSPRSRRVVVLAVFGIILTSAGSIWTYRPSSSQPADEHWVLNVGFLIMFAAAVLSIWSLAGRYRRSSGDERHQIKWVLWGTSIFVPVFMGLGFILGGSPHQRLLVAPIIFGLVVFLISYGVAVGKYRLYDVDVVINRSFVLAVLASFITLTYAVIVVGIGSLVDNDPEGLLLPIGATAVVAFAFEPIRVWAQRWANRLVYGNRATPYEVLSDLTRRLARAEEGEGLLDRLVVRLREGTGADRAVVWLGMPSEMTIAAASPTDVGIAHQPGLDMEASYPVTHDGEVVGALEVHKPRGTPLSPAERTLIIDLAGSVGAVLGYQRLIDSLAARAVELEQSRARLVGAQDQERRRLERELHEGAEQYIVALKVKLGVASQLAKKEDESNLVSLLEGLTEEAQAALDDVQSLAKGIYPPILESDGLGAAISTLATASPVEIHFARDGIERYPPEVEAAIYFDISEAVTNAVKHADPPIHIELFERSGTLFFSVMDGGPGFDVDESELGSGLENMADRLASVGGRLKVESSSGQVTRIRGEIPIRQMTPT